MQNSLGDHFLWIAREQGKVRGVHARRWHFHEEQRRLHGKPETSPELLPFEGHKAKRDRKLNLF